MPRYFGEEYPFDQIDHKVVKRVCSFLESKDLLKMSLINRAWYSLIKEILLIRKVVSMEAKIEDTRTANRLSNSLLQAFDFNSSKINLGSITTGYSPWAEIFKLSIDGKQYVVRLIKLEKEFAEREQETRVSTFLGGKGISPIVYYACPYEGIIIMAFIDAVPKWTHLLSSELMPRLASKIRSLHNVSLMMTRNHSVLKNGLPVVRHRKAVEVLKQYDFYLHAHAMQALDLFNIHIEEQGFSHNDLNPNNILFDGDNFWIIDLESAGLGDSFLDLGMIFASTRFSERQQLDFLNTYFDRPLLSSEKSRLLLMKIIAYLRLSVSFFTNCDNYSSLLKEDVHSIPTFHDYTPSRDGVVDMKSDKGKFFISIMLAKQALSYLTSANFSLPASQLFHSRNRFWGNNPWARFVADTVNTRIFSFLDNDTLAQAGLVNKQWCSLAISTLVYRNADRNQFDEVGMHLHSTARKKILSALKHNFVIDPRYPISLKPLKGGLSPWASIFLLTVNNKKYILRLLGEDSYYSRAREVYPMKTFSLKGASPIVEHVDLANGLVVMQHVDNDPRWPREITKTKLVDLARLLRSIHSIRIENSNEKLRSNEKFTFFERKIDNLAYKDARFSLFSRVLFTYRRLDKLLSPLSDKTLCHYDLNPWNLLYDGEQFWAIDWELSQIGHKYFDLATIINFLRLSEQDENFLLLCYFGSRISKNEMAYYYLIKQWSYLRYAICSLALCENFDFSLDDERIKLLPSFNKFIPGQKNPPFLIDKTTDEGKFMIAVMFANQAFENIQSHKFQNALSTLNLDQKDLMLHRDAKHSAQPTSGSYAGKLVKYGIFAAAAGVGLWVGYKIFTANRNSMKP